MVMYIHILDIEESLKPKQKEGQNNDRRRSYRH